MLLWVTGTEAGSEDMRDALKTAAKDNGYNFTVKSDVWIAVQKTWIQGRSWDTGFIKILDANSGSQRSNARGILWVEFDTESHGTFSVAVSHFMTHGSKPGDEYYAANGKLTRAIGEWGKVHGAGRKVCFFAGDVNTQDRTNDVFRGAPFTTLADELKDWQNTGHGSIDVIASYDADNRVKGTSWKVFDDKEFPLYADHFACEGGFEVRPVSAKKA